jgi:hypothetical protein
MGRDDIQSMRAWEDRWTRLGLEEFGIRSGSGRPSRFPVPESLTRQCHRLSGLTLYHPLEALE